MINHETLDCYGLHELGSDVHVAPPKPNVY